MSPRLIPPKVDDFGGERVGAHLRTSGGSNRSRLKPKWLRHATSVHRACLLGVWILGGTPARRPTPEARV